MKTTKEETETKPRRRTGQYTYAKFDRLCVCGLSLGRHMAEYPHDSEDGACEGFKAAKAAK